MAKFMKINSKTIFDKLINRTQQRGSCRIILAEYPSTQITCHHIHTLGKFDNSLLKIKKESLILHSKSGYLKNYESCLSQLALKNLILSLSPIYIATRGLKRSSGGSDEVSHLFVPVKYENSKFEENVGEEIVGPLKKDEVLSVISRFYSDEEIKDLAREQGLDQYLYQQTIISFRKYCIDDSSSLPTDLHIILSDIIKGANHIHDLYPYFYKHAKNIFPHLNCMEDLYKISDLTQPPNWYPEARVLQRKIIYHAGPTNSGKTYHALEQFLSAESGIYCGPLKLLAVEVFQKSNERGTPCDLVTGEERKYAVSEEFPSAHVACTVEMTSTSTPYDVAVIDEIQMTKDPLRGWAWTRALLGLCAKEIHVCGEGTCIDLIQELATSVGEDLEVRRYKRLTSLKVQETALVSLERLRPGDCIVCFSKQSIHKVCQTIEAMGHEVAVIYGGLPPGTKLAQANKFNDPDHPCKIMVATDAIGMGLNLCIQRIIFYSLIKPNTNEKGEKEMELISVSSALQIAGRAGRYGTPYEEGLVTTYKSSDLPVLHKLLNSTPPEITQAGIHPTPDQIELFAFHLPSYTLSNLIDIFVSLCTVDSSQYFMCLMDDFKFLADLIQHIPLPLRVRYVFCCAPINKKLPFVCALFLKFSRQYSQNEPATINWLCQQVKWPFSPPKTIHELVHLEEVFDVFDLYLWLSYRFPEMFPDAELLRELQKELDLVIQVGVSNITQLFRNSEVQSPNEKLKSSMSDVVETKRRKTDEQTKNLKQILQMSKNRKHGKSLTERLLRQGILSPKMLKELQMEWKLKENPGDEDDEDDSSGDDDNNHSFKTRKNMKKG